MNIDKNFPKAILYVFVITISVLIFQSCTDNEVDLDPDNDEIMGTLDNCENVANPNQEDNDNDGIGDACDDDDDNDGIIDSEDNCPFVPNFDQADSNSNGIGDVCEAAGDTDNDGILNGDDNCILTENPNQEDNDGDGIGDACDDDDDNDGIIDTEDNCPFTENEDQGDNDGDGIGNACDEDYVEPLNPCVDGMAGNYPCDGYDLMAHIPVNELGGNGAEGNDSWGWTDPETGKEYALVGTTTGTAFVDISDTENLKIIGILPTATTNSLWRDVKVYNNHAFIVSEASNHGMQVFDLTRLRNTNPIVQNFTADAHYNAFGKAHNIVINEDSGYAYAVGTQTFGGGAHFVNIQDPINPVSAGGFSAGGYSHDAQVVTYNGPDSDYTGQEILIGSNENEVVIADITDKSNPTIISTVAYSNIGYTHQGWFTEDSKYFILGDETDELNNGGNTRTLVFDFTDLDNPSLHSTYTGPTAAIDHNGYVKGDTFYLANYSAGVRFIDISNIENGTLVEEGYFDTFPSHNNTSFNGVWNVYPYFESGNIIINDIEGGLFVVRKNGL
ncbi:choice-of-anchor B family protein [Urechidicola croceus]|uniref:Regulator n=1 Tax=Urechidicola croceus TaxID=1850246 RepID=A0A1D8P9U2_9FLAO|nr:choice-of-anchor B family protein [Urechidicola croceus]AOW21348.1 regulator [Urechidicola croceus]